MASISLLPSPVSYQQAAMSTRRAPLTSNPAAANSPLKPGNAAVVVGAALKLKRSHASNQREESYGQPPPKKQMLGAAYKPNAHSPAKSRPMVHGVSVARVHLDRERSAQQASKGKFSTKDIEQIQKWVATQKAQFPRHVFYFESVPDDVRAKLARQIALFGAREEKFFSINITHVVTTRTVPPVQPAQPAHKAAVDSNVLQPRYDAQPQTINPSLLSRTTDLSTMRKLFDTPAANRRPPIQLGDDAVRRSKVSRPVDLLERARDMGKKIWSLEKMQKVVGTMLEPDPYRCAALGYGARNTVQQTKPAEEGSLLQLLNKERVTGPSDRDPTAPTKELHTFKGPYLYIYDIEEKLRPIMVREYPKVTDKLKGDWPQFRSSVHGRCPFVDDEAEKPKKDLARQATVKAAVGSAPKLQPPVQISRPRPITGKKPVDDDAPVSAANMTAGLSFSGLVQTKHALEHQEVETEKYTAPMNAFISSNRNKTRLLAGEPVASGLQPSGITSAIRSQVISSTTGTLAGTKHGISKEVMGLQRKVLQKSGTVSQDPSSFRYAELSVDSGSFTRSASMGAVRRPEGVEQRRTHSVPTKLQPKPKRRDPKPGYCENCQDKFDDFEEHIQSRPHRKFAENDENWGDLDKLLKLLKRCPVARNVARDDVGSDDTEYLAYDEE